MDLKEKSGVMLNFNQLWKLKVSIYLQIAMSPTAISPG